MIKILTATTAALLAWMLYWAADYEDRVGWVTTYQQSIANEWVIPKRPNEISEVDFASVVQQMIDEKRQSAQFAREGLPYAREQMQNSADMLNDMSGAAAAVLALCWIILLGSQFRLRVERRTHAKTETSDGSYSGVGMETEDEPVIATV